MMHMGFKGAQRSIEEREGVSEQSAGRILGAGARNASPAAKKKTPRLKKVSEPKSMGRKIADQMAGYR